MRGRILVSIPGPSSQLTAQEFRSLRHLRVPVWWLSQTAKSQSIDEGGRRNVDIAGLDRFGRVPQKSSDRHTLPLLEGKWLFRHPENPRLLVVVGEFQSCVHLCGVGTRWRAGFRDAIAISHTFRVRLWCQSILGVLQSNRVRRSGLRWFEWGLPYPPTPFACQSPALSWLHEIRTATVAGVRQI